MFFPSDPEDASDIFPPSDPNLFNKPNRTSSAALHDASQTSSVSRSSLGVVSQGDDDVEQGDEDDEEVDEERFPWMLSDDEDDAFSSSEQAENDDDDDEFDDESVTIAREEVEHLRSDLQCPGMDPTQVKTVTGLLKLHTDRLLCVMLSAAAQDLSEPMQIAARLLEDTLGIAQQVGLLFDVLLEAGQILLRISLR